jgi:aldose sugar dehydrogenase
MPSPKNAVPGDLRGRCICARCPTYNECTRKGKELLYCFEGKSSCKLERYGCVCGSCPVQKSGGFMGAYFCVTGKADTK